MSRRRGLEVAALALACLGAPSCGSTGGEGSRTPTGGSGSMANMSGDAGAPVTAGMATGGSAVGGISNSGKAGETASAGSSANAGSSSGGGSSGGAGTGPWTFPTGVTKPKIMIVGDSISAGPGCYKKFLLKDLTDNGYKNLEFIGEYADDCGGGVRHSAVSCSTAEQYTQATFMMPNCRPTETFPGMSTLVAKHNPDLIMLQLGVNDVWNSKPTADILGNYTKLVTQARANNPNVVLVVAQIQKIRPDCSTDDAITKRAEALVMAVPAWAAQQSTAKSPVFVADLWTNSDWSMAETLDCVHPNDVGAEKMGMNWYNALKGILTPG